MRLKTILESVLEVDTKEEYWFIELRARAKKYPDDEIEIYRVVFGTLKTEIENGGAGYHWTVKEQVLHNQDVLKQIFGDDNSFYENDIIAEVHGKVKLKDINWVMTEAQNMKYKNEYEILVNDPKDVEITKFVDYRIPAKNGEAK